MHNAKGSVEHENPDLIGVGLLAAKGKARPTRDPMGEASDVNVIPGPIIRLFMAARRREKDDGQQKGMHRGLHLVGGNPEKGRQAIFHDAIELYLGKILSVVTSARRQLISTVRDVDRDEH